MLMNIKEATITLFNDLHKSIFSYFNIPNDSLYHRRGNSLNNDAKMYLYYILHYEYNFSVGQIAQLTHKTSNNIFKCIAKIKFYISMYDDYSNDYNCIMVKLKNEITE